MMIDRKKLLLILSAAYFAGCAASQPLPDSGEVSLKKEPSLKAGASAGAMYQLGRYYQGQSRYEQAITAYQKSLAADNTSAEAHNGLGVVYSKLGQFDAAIEAFNAALKLSPQSAHIYNNLGYAYYLQGQYDQALAILKQASVLEPDNKRVQTNLDLVYQKTGNASQTAHVADVNAASLAEVAVEAPVEPRSTEYAVSPREDSGAIMRASDPDVRVLEIAPAVYRLERRQDVRTEQPEQTKFEALRLEISNGNGIVGMAKKVGLFLRSLGYKTARLTNQKPFKVMHSELQYRSGYLQEAETLQSNIHGQPKLVQRDDLRSDINLRLVIGKDLIDNQADFNVR